MNRKIETRDIYVPIFNFVSKDKLKCHDFNEFIDKNDIIIYQSKIGFVSGDKPNPFDQIYVYKTKDSAKSYKLEAYKKDKDKFTLLMPQNYQEHITTIYYKHKNNNKRINELIDIFKNII